MPNMIRRPTVMQGMFGRSSEIGCRVCLLVLEAKINTNFCSTVCNFDSNSAITLIDCAKTGSEFHRGTIHLASKSGNAFQQLHEWKII